jgi:hypothetical protein
MCPVCFALGGFYVAGGVSAGAVTTFMATRFFVKRRESTSSIISTETKRDDQFATDDRTFIGDAGPIQAVKK